MELCCVVSSLFPAAEGHRPCAGAGVALRCVVLCPCSFHLQTLTSFFLLLRNIAHVRGGGAGAPLRCLVSLLCPAADPDILSGCRR